MFIGPLTYVIIFESSISTISLIYTIYQRRSTNKSYYEKNKDIYEKTDLIILNENEAEILFIMKNLFPDLGLPQRYAYLKVNKLI